MYKRKGLKELGKRRIALDVREVQWARIYAAAQQSYCDITEYCMRQINEALDRDVAALTDAEIIEILKQPRNKRIR